MVERIVLLPSEDGSRLDVALDGALSSLLALALFDEERQRKKARKAGLVDIQATDVVEELVLVAGGRNRRSLPTLMCLI